MLGSCFGQTAQAADNTARSLLGCLCVLIVLGPVLIVIGAVMFASSATDTRAALVKTYNGAVDTWSKTDKDVFAAAVFSVNATRMNAVTSDEDTKRFSDSHTDFVTNYPHLVYRNANPAAKILYNYNPDLRYTIRITVGSNTTSSLVYYDFSISPFVEKQVSVSCSDSQARKKKTSNEACRSRECSNQGGTIVGTYPNDKCYVRLAVSEVCIKFDVSNNVWKPATVGGSSGFGCQRYSFTNTIGDWAPESYIQAKQGTQLDPTTIPILVRSLKDPYVQAGAITNGSLFFGLTPGEKRIIGTIMIVIGIVLMIPMCCLIHYLKRRNQQKLVVMQQQVYVQQPGQPMGQPMGQPYPALHPQPNHNYPPMQDPGYPPQNQYNQGYPPQNQYNQGYPPQQQQGYPPQQQYNQGYPPQQNGY